jgi:hypothetical protein
VGVTALRDEVHRPRGLRARLGFDGNPLRRTTDWTESAAAAALLAVFVLLTPVAAMLTGQWAYQKGAAAEQAQAGDSHEVRARVVDTRSVGSASADGTAMQSSATVRWAGPDGRSHRDTLRVSTATDKGDTVPVWIDAQGRQVSPPLTHSQVVANAVTTGLLTVAGAAVLLGGVWYLLRRRLDRVRMDEWEAEWLTVSTRWDDRDGPDQGWPDQGWPDPR